MTLTEAIATAREEVSELRERIDKHERLAKTTNDDDGFRVRTHHQNQVKMLKEQLTQKVLLLTAAEESLKSAHYMEALRQIDTHVRATKAPVPHIIGELVKVLPEYEDHDGNVPGLKENVKGLKRKEG